MFLTLLFFAPQILQASTWNMTPGATPMSHQIYDLHMMVFWVCVGIAVVVFSVMIWAIIFHRKSLGHQAAPFHESTVIEIAWTIIPIIILAAMAWPATKVLIAFEDTSHPDLTIKIVGYQWFWEYDYVDDDVHFFSYSSTDEAQIQNSTPKGINYLQEVDEPLVLPVGKKIRLLTTAADVQHSFWVPALGFKRDAIPGFINESWTRLEKAGIYRGRCAELCGFKHGFMPIEIHAVSEQEFQEWLKKKKASH
jgi:cytochrome c oxidase subunit 2